MVSRQTLGRLSARAPSCRLEPSPERFNRLIGFWRNFGRQPSVTEDPERGSHVSPFGAIAVRDVGEPEQVEEVRPMWRGAVGSDGVK